MAQIWVKPYHLHVVGLAVYMIYAWKSGNCIDKVWK